MRTSLAILILAAAGVGAFGACDDAPARPSPPPVGPPALGVLRVEIKGPETIAPGQTASYSAIEHLSDGNSRTQTTAAWSTSDSTLIQITQAGLATASQKRGEGVVSVKTTQSASKEVMVLPVGTFRLVGQVLDDLTGGPVSGASINAIGGPTVTTNGTGEFKLYGVTASAEIGVTGDGYFPLTQRIDLTSHSTRQFRLVRLPVVGPPPPQNFAGNYTLTLEAAATCTPTPQPPLLEHLKVRSYEATIVQTQSLLEVLLTEPRFALANGHGNRFSGSVTPNGAYFVIAALNPDYQYYFTDIREQLPDGSLLLINGTAETTWSAQGFTGAFANSGFEHLMPPFILGLCNGSRFTMTPR